MHMRAVQKIERPKMVTELVHERLRQDIVNGVFELGEKISEGQIAEYYGVTKAPIRKAYALLHSEGLVEVRPQSGTYVFKPTRDDLRAICELRLALEVEAARLSMRRAPERLRSDMIEICASMQAALAEADQQRYLALDKDLHLSLLACADSPYLYEIYQSRVSSIFSALRCRFAHDAAHNDASSSEHYQIRDAVLAGDLETLAQVLRKHVRNTEVFYEKWVGK